MNPATPNPLHIRVTLNTSTPVYRQIVDTIRAHCVSGDLKPGTRLPTVRTLAASLGIHFNTVAEAYRLLSDEGWLRIDGRRGVTLLDRQLPRTPSPSAQANASNRLRHLIAELQSTGLSPHWIRTQLEAALTSNAYRESNS